MAYPINQPFPVPSNKPLVHKIGAQALTEYLQVFRGRRNQRPDGKFADADIFEFMRLAEHLDKVANIEMQFINSELLRKSKGLFKHQAQMARLRIFIVNHKRRNKASKADDFVDSVLDLPPIGYFRQAVAMDLIMKAEDLSRALDESRGYYVEHGSVNPELVDIVNARSDEIANLVDGFSLSDVDETGKFARKAKWRDVANFFRRMTGDVDHEAKWLEKEGRWTSWNRDINVFPDVHEGEKALTATKLSCLIANNDPVRIVAGGHTFNESPDTGGKKSAPVGTLITLDNLSLSEGGPLKSVKSQMAKDLYGLQDGRWVFRVSAGMRLRDFTAAAWDKGAALPVAGSTDAQSIGGLIATDLHSTGRTHGFLSERLLEVVTLDHKGLRHRFRRNDRIPNGPGRWTWRRPPHGSTEKLAKLPVSGALGMTGVVVEAVVQLVPKFAFLKNEQYVPRKWVEANVHRLLDPHETDNLFDYDHVSLYLGGGVDPKRIKTVRLNSWKHTEQTPPPDALRIQRSRELLDHAGSAFLPNTIVKYSQSSAPKPGTNQGGDSQLRNLNDRDPQVLQANHAFARKLYFQHDEIESGIPLLDVHGQLDYGRFREALQATLELLYKEEFKTIIEVRFTPDTSEAMLGPGAGVPTCYIELATSMTQFSRRRIVQVYQRFDQLLRKKFNARPHLGKKTSAGAKDLKALYPASWQAFNKVRKTIDPGGKFRPRNNELLNRLFERA